jgi:AcrR family transcriptional regulator
MGKAQFPTASLDDTRSELSSHDRILQAGRRLFAEDGYENTTTSAIARQAGTSESQLIKHFGSKEGLLEAIFEEGWERMGQGIRQVLAQPREPIERLRALAELMIDGLEQDRELRTLMLLEGRRIRRHGHMVVLTRGFLQMVGAIDGVLLESRKAGQIRPDLDLQAVRSALIGAFEGLLRDRLLAERLSYPAAYDSAELRSAFRAVLEGFVARPAGDAAATL